MSSASTTRKISLQVIEEVLPRIKVGQHALEVARTVSRGDYILDDIQREIEKDPGLTASTLSVSNSIAFNPSGFEIKTVKEACLRIGGKAIIHASLSYYAQKLAAHRVATAAKGKKAAKDVISLSEDKLGGAMRHMHQLSATDDAFYIAQAERVGYLAMQIAYLVGEPESDLFTLGVLHDVGLLVISAWDKTRVDQVSVRAKKSEDDQDVTAPESALYHSQNWQAGELSVYGTDHARVGAYFLEHIGLPAAVVQPVLHHNQPSHAPEIHAWKTLAVHLASCLNYLRCIQDVSGHAVSTADQLERLLHACCEPAVSEHITFWKKQLFEIYQNPRSARR